VGDLYLNSPEYMGLKGEAEAMYRRALEQNPNHSYANHKMGRYLLFRTNRAEEAIEHLRRATEKVGGNLPAHMDYLSVQFYHDKNFGMDDEFGRAMEKANTEYDRLNLLVSHAQYKVWTMDYEAAQEMIDEASELQKKLNVPPTTQVN
jgi:tetratricopeptide (TPR) repeat protein